MSVRYFCDQCGNELQPSDHGRIRRGHKRVWVEVMIAVDRVWNAGNVCHACTVHAVANGRPETEWHLEDDSSMGSSAR